jgi:hypothetical protein
VVLWATAVLLYMAWQAVQPLARKHLPKVTEWCQQRCRGCINSKLNCCGCCRPKLQHTEEAPALQEMAQREGSNTASSAPAEAMGSSVSNQPEAQQESFWAKVAAYSTTAALVVFFANYQTVVQAAMGMLWCVEVDGSWWWVMDVRLRCPTQIPRAPWAHGAVAMGILLLLWSLFVPLALGSYLAAHVVIKSIAKSTGAGDSGPLAALAYRYADYNVSDDIREGDGKLVCICKRSRMAVRIAWDSVTCC